MNKEEIIKELDKQNRELGEELSLTKDRLDKTLFEKDHYKHLYSEVKKQKDDGIKYIKEECLGKNLVDDDIRNDAFKNLLRMLGETDVED